MFGYRNIKVTLRCRYYRERVCENRARVSGLSLKEARRVPLPKGNLLVRMTDAFLLHVRYTPRYRRNGYLLGAGTITGNLVEKQVCGRPHHRRKSLGRTISPCIVIFRMPVPRSLKPMHQNVKSGPLNDETRCFMCPFTGAHMKYI